MLRIAMTLGLPQFGWRTAQACTLLLALASPCALRAQTAVVTLNVSATATLNSPVSLQIQLIPAGGTLSSASGTISDLNGSTVGSACGTINLTSGSGSCVLTAIPAGTYSFQVAASGIILVPPFATPSPFMVNSNAAPVTENKASPTLTLGDSGTTPQGSQVTIIATLGGATFSPIAPTGKVQFTANSANIDGCNVAVNGNIATCYTTALPGGTVSLGATMAADSNYYATAATPVNILITVPPTINFPVAEHHTLDAPFTVAATSNSSGTFTYNVQSGPASLSGGNTVTLTGSPGLVTVVASQAANGNYEAYSKTTYFDVFAGSTWLANPGGSLSVFAADGTPLIQVSGGGLGSISGPQTVAFDSTGDVWAASANGVSEFSFNGTPLSTTAVTAGGIANPASLAVDGAGLVWIANANATLSVLNNNRTAAVASAYPATGNGVPGAIAIDLSGNVWVTTPTANTVTEVIGIAAPVAPLAIGQSNGSTGQKP